MLKDPHKTTIVRTMRAVLLGMFLTSLLGCTLPGRIEVRPDGTDANDTDAAQAVSDGAGPD